MDNSKILYFDIETSLMEFYGFQCGYNLSISSEQIKKPSRIICISYMWGDSKKAECLTWNNKTQDDSKMLLKFNKIAAKADLIVGHNGQNFDVKEIRAAMALRGLKEAWCETPCIDTLKDYRRVFKFKSNKLDSVARSLGIGKKAPMGLQDWINVSEGKPGALEKMVKYCKQDTKLLREVHKRLDYYVPPTMLTRGLKLMKDTNIPKKCPACNHKDIIKYGKYSYKGQDKQKFLCKGCYKVIK